MRFTATMLEFSMHPFFIFACLKLVSLRLPIPHEDGSDIKRFSDVLHNEIMVCAKELKGVKALIDGKLVRSLKHVFHMVM